MIRANPGTELGNLIPSFFKEDGCGCRAYAAKMNHWGVHGCRQRFDEIVDHLVAKAQERAITAIAGETFGRIVAKRWVTKAIDAAAADERRRLSINGDWYVAVTTAPRKECTLAACVTSIRRAGWEPVVFAEPGSSRTDAITIHNEEKLGCWHNWLASSRFALANSDAEIILTVQDDSGFHPDSRTFTESILWPDENAAFVSLYTPKHYSLLPRQRRKMRDPGVNLIYTRSLWGACALAFPRKVLQEIVDSDSAKSWLGAPPRSGSRSVYQKRRENPSMIANSDTAIGKIIREMGRKMYFIDPSPVQHIATYSTLSNHGSNKGRRNCLRCADHDVPLADQVPVYRDTP